MKRNQLAYIAWRLPSAIWRLFSLKAAAARNNNEIIMAA